MVTPTWCHRAKWGNPIWGECRLNCLPNLHFWISNSSKYSATVGLTVLCLWRSLAAPVVPGIPRQCISSTVKPCRTIRNLFTPASAFQMQHDIRDKRQQACPFPAGVVSLVSGEVKHVVHLIRWNLKAVCANWGKTWPRSQKGNNARPLGS